jgi:hypothetical protein
VEEQRYGYHYLTFPITHTDRRRLRAGAAVPRRAIRSQGYPVDVLLRLQEEHQLVAHRTTINTRLPTSAGTSTYHARFHQHIPD